MGHKVSLTLFAIVMGVGVAASEGMAQNQAGDSYAFRQMFGPEFHTWEKFENSSARQRNLGRNRRGQAADANVKPATALGGPGRMPVRQASHSVAAHYGQGPSSFNPMAYAKFAGPPPRPSNMSAAPRPQRQASKPFQAASNGATISPYNNLFREDENEVLPNYYSFVRPQMQQQQANRQQQNQLQGLERQVQQATYRSYNQGTGMPATGHSVRFGDTGGYFGTNR